MNIVGKNIRHVSTLTHDGKVLVFGTAADGAIHYSIKRSGFEDSSVKAGSDPFGFEDWKPLRLGESATDASVIADDQRSYLDGSGVALLRSVYGNTAEVTTTVDAPVQVVSALGHLCVFRQSPTGKVLVSRFVLDGMANELVPKLEVRFRRSGQRLAPDESATAKSGANFDNLDYRDISGKSFYEPSRELGFAGTVTNGWFAPVFVPTAEGDRFRWHLFAFDAASQRLVLHTVGAEDSLFFDVKDYLYGMQDPSDAEKTIYRSIPGLLRRSLDLSGLTIAGCPAATTYDLQTERITDHGPQLVREATRIMLAVPVKATGSTVITTAVLSFALAKDGTLSQVDLSPDSSTILKGNVREILTPISLLDSIKEIAAAVPAPSGTIAATERGDKDQLKLKTNGTVPADLKRGARVKVSGTQTYDGHYKVLAIDGTSFQVDAVFANDEAGRFEVVPEVQTGLVFDNMVVGSERTADGKLLIRCPTHDLAVGDGVQISGTQMYDGTFPITAIDADKTGFTLEAAFFTGEAANLQKVARRGLRMASGDRLETPDLALDRPNPERDFGRTVSAWVRLDALGNLEQRLIQDGGGLMSLAIGADNKASLAVRLSDGATRTVIDPAVVPVNVWAHFAGAVDYRAATGGNTAITLCRDGVEVAQQSVIHGLPCHLGNQLIDFDGVDDGVEAAQTPPNLAGKSYSVEMWVKRARFGVQEFFFWQGTEGALNCGLHIGFRGDNSFAFGTWGNDLNSSQFSPDTRWHHYACTYNHLTHTKKVYRDGVLFGELVTDSHYLGTGAVSLGRFSSGLYAFKGNLADVRVWSYAREQPEIAADMCRRLAGRETGLLAYWPLDNGTTKDLSPAKRHGAMNGGPAWSKIAYLYPQGTPETAGLTRDRFMKLDGVQDFIVVPAFASPTSAITVSVWARSATPTWNAFGCLVSKRNAFLVHPWTGERKVDVTLWTSGGAVTVTCAPDDIQRWHMFTFTYDGSLVRLYVDGIQVAQAAASGPVDADAAGQMFMGHDDGYGPLDRNFGGQIADVQVWSRARTPAEILQSMNSKPSGAESGLAGCWPLETGPEDLSPNQRHGVFSGAPRACNLLGYTLGGSFTGEMADAQIWEKARTAAEIKRSMHLPLTGKETGLVACYRMGAVVYEAQPPITPDFSIYGSSAVVYGSPYAGARRFNRWTGSGLKVIKLGSSELCSVSQRGIYEESLEFRVTSTDPAFDPSNADGTGRRLFTFAYWGKSSRASKEILPFPSGNIQQGDFESLGGGWYKATCRAMVPDGVTLMRAFELGDVRGRWGAETKPPANEWTSLEVRRHHIRLISDAITRECYTDTAALASLTVQSPALLGSMTDMGRSELKVGRSELLIADLVARIDVAQNNARYTAEKTSLTTKLSGLQSQRTTAQNERAALVADPYSYFHKLRAKHSQMTACPYGAAFPTLMQTDGRSTEIELFRFKDLGGGKLMIFSKTDAVNPVMVDSNGGLVLNGPSANVQEPLKSNLADAQAWIYGDLGDGYGMLESAWFRGRVFDVMGAAKTWAASIQAYPWNGGDNQRWRKEKTAEMTPSATDAIAAKAASITAFDPQISATQQRIDWLTLALSGAEPLATLQSQLTTAQATLSTVRAELTTNNTAVMGALTAIAPVAMPGIATDDRDLTTMGAVLAFVNPLGRVGMLESAEGNVLLTYVDQQSRLRVLPYDVAADSRNAAFEQWLPEGARACADLRDSGDKVTLSQPLSLPASGWTCEAWIQYPLATLASGLPYASNAVAAADSKNDAPIVIARGNRLGIMADGWFFDSGVDLSRVLAVGWHHVAAATAQGAATFYIDGVKVGGCTCSQPALRLGGAADWVEVPAHASPTAALTVSVWARSTGATWNKSANLVAKRDAFVMHPNQGGKDMVFYVFVGGAWKAVTCTMPEIQGWHLYTGTYDGNNLTLFVDGELRAQVVLTGAIAADAGVLVIGSDDAANTATNGPLAGDIAEVSVWSVARSMGDIRQDLYRTFKGDEVGLVGYWRMTQTIDGGVTKVKDLSPGARHGLVKGAPLDVGITTQRIMDIKVLGNLAAGGSPVGRLAEVRLWSLGLSADEIAANARVILTGNEPGLLGYFPLNEGAGVTAVNRSAGATANGVMAGVDWVGSTAPIGLPCGRVLNLSDRGSGYVTGSAVALAGKSFTVECWGRRSGGNMGVYVAMVGMGTVNAANQILWLGFTSLNKPFLGFNGNDVESTVAVTDTDWHHFCGTYDQPTRKQRIYCDGVLVGERTAPADYTGGSNVYLGKTDVAASFFSGAIAEVRLWDRARTEAEIRGSMRQRLSGAEAGLLGCYPLDDVSTDGKVTESKSGLAQGQLLGSAQVVLSTSLPVLGADSVVAMEYSTVDLSPEGKKQALMRRMLGFAVGGTVKLFPEQRVEELTLQWVGNSQINPTLLGYIEGAPPVPSENLTQEEDYDDATRVTLSQSDTTSYTWQRSEASSSAFSMDGFVGIGWEVDGGIGISTKMAEGKVGESLGYSKQDTQTQGTSVSATTSLTTSDSLSLTGIPEKTETFPALGTRWVPKNVGYALVISGMADVFVTKLKRSGRMVSYDIRPVEGVPLDVNTITFLINPAYTLNGSLDGMVGSSPADEVFYPHVPAMRAQYGSLYPASYYRLTEAYALKESVERQDKERESFFYNFHANQLSRLDSFGTATMSVSSAPSGADATTTPEQSDQQKKAAQSEAEQRKADIGAKHTGLQGKMRAGAAFADWQVRMSGIETKAGKRNVVNTYVWDGDGGLRAEQESFASTVEHSISAEATESVAAGLSADTLTAGFCLGLSLMGSGATSSGTSKTLGTARSLELTVDLSGVEKDFITDLKDNPRVPGEKVDRYRFMTFYLEGSTDHFNDFFTTVVDPEWLQSNDEEARSLRQARGAKPNKCWRVLHRVTYVERPALSNGLGHDTTSLSMSAIVTPNPLARQAELVARIDGLEAKLDAILANLSQA